MHDAAAQAEFVAGQAADAADMWLPAVEEAPAAPAFDALTTMAPQTEVAAGAREPMDPRLCGSHHAVPTLNITCIHADCEP